MGSHLSTLTKFLELASWLLGKSQAAAPKTKSSWGQEHSLACSSCRHAVDVERLTTAVQAPAHSGRLLQVPDPRPETQTLPPTYLHRGSMMPSTQGPTKPNTP